MTGAYIDEIQSIAEVFRYVLCDECMQDLDAHILAPDVLGHAHAYCIREES